MPSIAKLGTSLLLILGACGASAQTMYRCGSVYQDRPCETGAAAKVLRSSGAEATPGSAPRANAAADMVTGVANQGASPLGSRPSAPDPQCVRRGMDAQQIVWSRESGKTADDLSRLAQSEYQRQLITEVYSQRGSAPQVRDSVQARCQKDKETMGFIPYPPSAQGNVPASQAKPLTNSEAQGTVSPEVSTSTYNRCDHFKAQRESIRTQERQGGSIQVMETLSQRRKSLEQEAGKQGC